MLSDLFHFLSRCGELYNIEFLQKMKIVSKDLNLSERVQSLLHTMCTEVRCPAQPKFATATNLTTDSGVNKPKDSGSPANGACDEKKDTKLSQPSGNATSETVITTEESSGKRKCLAEDEPSLKRCKVESRVPDDKMPPFYYDVHQRKIKNVDIPKYVISSKDFIKGRCGMEIKIDNEIQLIKYEKVFILINVDKYLILTINFNSKQS